MWNFSRIAWNKQFLLLFFLLFSILYAQEKLELLSEPENPQDKNVQTFNMLLYSEEWTSYENYLVRFLPFYSYQRNKDLLQDDFFFWPLLVGYEINRNPVATTLAHSSNFQWRGIPFFTLGGSHIYPTESKEISSTVSLLLMTFSREISSQKEYHSKEWYSLPVLSSYYAEHSIQKDSRISHTVISNPLFYIQDSHVEYDEQNYSAYEWSIHPLSLILGKNSFYLAYQGRWGRDSLFEILGCDGFSLFTVGTTVAEYPGANYQKFSLHEDIEKSVYELFHRKPNFPTTRLGILYPFFMVETNPNAGFRWQILPIFHYYSEREKYALQILPLFLEISQDGFFLKVSPKFFPLVHHDETLRRWDILWPLFYYQSNPSFSAEKLGCRFLFEYEKVASTQSNQSKTKFHIIEGLVASYQSSNHTSQFEILPGGILFGYYETALDMQWRLLGCGYEETSQRSSLQILFIKIPLQYKYNN